MTGRDVETDKSSWTSHLLLSSLHLRVLRVPSRAGMVGRYRKQAINYSTDLLKATQTRPQGGRL